MRVVGAVGLVAPCGQEGFENPFQPSRNCAIVEKTIHTSRGTMRLFKRRKDSPHEPCPRCGQLVSERDGLMCPLCGWDLREAYQGPTRGGYGEPAATTAPDRWDDARS